MTGQRKCELSVNDIHWETDHAYLIELTRMILRDIKQKKVTDVMDSSSVTSVFQDIEPGWSCIYFSHPPKVRKSRFHVLMQSLESWRENFPMRRIERIQVVKAGGIVRGLTVLWSILDGHSDQSQIAHFQIDEELRDLYGHEYNEALMHDALGFAAENPTAAANVVLVSRRRVAIVIVKQTQQAYLMTFAKLLAAFDGKFAEQLASQFDAWATPDAQGYFFSVLPDSYHP